MFVWNKAKSTDDEPILRVRYRPVVGRMIGLFFVAMGGLFIISFDVVVQRRGYDQAILATLCGAALLLVGLEILFTNRILFYKDRIVKEWYLLGERSIPYEKAVLRYASKLNAQQPAKCYTIRETNPSGSVSYLQVPIWFAARCASQDTVTQLDAVLSYLVGVDDHSTPREKLRSFERAELSKEVICQIR